MIHKNNVRDSERDIELVQRLNGNDTNSDSHPEITQNSNQPLRSILKIRIPSDQDHLVNGNQNIKIESQAGTGTKKKKKRRDKSDLGDNFVAPDGGWGWLVAIAAGITIFVIFAVAQNFGIIFRGHMTRLGITTAELTSIINVQIAVAALTGLLNGPMFRRFTFRQVAIFGSFLSFAGLFLSVFAGSFVAYVLAFSCCYGFGRGLAVSAASLAVNTYFKNRRRTATAYQFGVAGLGPIINPFITTYMLYYFDVEGTVLIFSGLSLHAIACSLIYQPVMWHVKLVQNDAESTPEQVIPEEEVHTIVEPDTPTLPRSNDGWYGSRISLNSINDIRRRSANWEKRRDSSDPGTPDLNRQNSREHVYYKKRATSISQSIKEENSDEDIDQESMKMLNTVEQKHNNNDIEEDMSPKEKTNLKPKTIEELEMEYQKEDEERRKLPFYKKIIIFFDLDLLRDFGYVNLSVGITLINFVEINFAILTPFILADFGFDDNQIALAMSLLGFSDLVVRFLVPLITSKMNFSNKTFFIIGIIGMCFGRMLLAFTRDFYCLIAIFLWLGLNKAFRTVFWSLIIPSYVPLKRLPAAAGLQLLMSGIFSLAFGPVIGIVRDRTSYGFALQFLNIICVFAVAVWLIEELYRKKLKPKAGHGNE